jgi:hypothetical protein
MPGYALIAVLAIALQVMINQRYIAYFAMIVYYIVSVAGSRWARQPDAHLRQHAFHHLLGHERLRPLPARERWYKPTGRRRLVLMLLSLLFWARGTNDGWRQRLQLARHA